MALNTDHLEMPMLYLSQKILDELKAIFSKHIPNIEVLAYGSRIKGTAHEGSDLDLVLIHPEGKPIESSQFHALKNALEESNIPILIDVVDWIKIPESFKKEISATNVKIH